MNQPTYSYIGYDWSPYFGTDLADTPEYHLAAWAVRDGDSNAVAGVPEPTTLLLLGTALVGLAGARLRKKK